MQVSEKIKAKLQVLPDKPGVYMMRDRHGRIIYIGKAASLRSRVRSYFQKGTLRSADPKLRGLIRSADDLEIIELRNEAEAILTEGRLIKEYRPRYNVMFRDDKRFLLLRVNLNDPFPRFKTARIKKDDGSTYFGPYASSGAARASMEFCDKRFGLRVCHTRIPGAEDYKHCMNDVIRFCTAPCMQKVTQEEYLAKVEDACAFLRGERREALNELREQMEKAAEHQQFEKAAALRDTLFLIQNAIKQRTRGEKTREIKAAEAMEGVVEIREALGLEKNPKVIECFDISNISGTYAVASMVCSVDGVPAKNRYRRFRIKTIEGIDDPAMMGEVIRRRYSRLQKESKPMPDLIVVDGGITQLRAAQAELAELGLSHLPIAGLAKRFEELHVDRAGEREVVRLPYESRGLLVLQRIRDEAHRFALTYHREIRGQRIRDSLLDDVPGIGKKRKQVLLEHFGSVSRIKKATVEQIAEAPGIGKTFAELVKKTLE